MKAAIYARHSSDRQNQASSIDQIERCQKWAVQNGYEVMSVYSDEALSGAGLITRPGIQRLIDESIGGSFRFIICEDLSRLSRDQEDIAHFFKRMDFLGIEIVTLSEGSINHLHIGLKGTMNALYLKDLADKTLRGNISAVLKGKVPGGQKIFGYDQGRTEAEGILIPGKRVINEEEAKIVRQIFDYFIAGKPLPWIAEFLNDTGISPASGKEWRVNSFAGTASRQAGLLRQTLYNGYVTFNKLSYRTNPETNRRVSIVNPKEDWISVPVPDLKILDDGIFKKAQAEFEKRKKKKVVRSRIRKAKPLKTTYREINQKSRLKQAENKHVTERYIISGKSFCGHCGAKLEARSGGKLGCSNRSCNRSGFPRDEVLNSVHKHLADLKPIDFKNSIEISSKKVEKIDIQIHDLMEQRKTLRLNIESFLEKLLGQEFSSTTVTDFVEKKEIQIRSITLQINDLKSERLNHTPLTDPMAIKLHKMLSKYRDEYLSDMYNAGKYLKVYTCLKSVKVFHDRIIMETEVDFDIAEMIKLAKYF